MSDHFWLRQCALWVSLGLTAWLMFSASITLYQGQSDGVAEFSIYPLLGIALLAALASFCFSRHAFEAVLGVAVGLALGVAFLAAHFWLMLGLQGNLLMTFVKAWLVGSAMIYTIAPILLVLSMIGYALRSARMHPQARTARVQSA